MPKSTWHFQSRANLLTLGVVDVNQAVRNFEEGGARSRHAYENGCYVEVISLRLQHIDFWLRMFFVARNRQGKIFDASDKRTFGVLLADCERLGFSDSLVQRMRAFNASRVDCIHKYLLGAICYDDLKEVCDAHVGLDGDVSRYVGEQVGVTMIGE